MKAQRALAIAACAAATVLWSQLGLARLATVHHHTFDLAEYTRLAWGLAHGAAWDSIVGGNVLGGHMPFVLLPLAAIGALWSALWGDGLGTAKVLICAQAAAMAFSGYPLFRIARRWLDGGAAVLVLLAYLAYPTLGHVATYEMHPGSLALLPLAFALDALDARDARRLWIASLCVLSCRASFGLEVMCLGALALRDTRTLRRTGIAIAAGAFSYLALSMFVLRPLFGAHGGPESLDLHFGPWGGSPFGFALALVTRPLEVLAHLGTPERLRYIPMVLAPFAFVPLLAPRTLLVALPAIALNLASVFPTTTRIDSHYLTSAVPALCVSAIYGLHRLGSEGPRILRATASLAAPGARTARVRLRPLAFAVLAVSALANAIAGGMPWSLDFVASDFAPDARTHAARRILALSPAGASVQAPDPLLPHLAERERVHRAPPPDRDTRYVVLDLSHRERYAEREDLLRTREEPLARNWLARANTAVLGYAPPYVLLGRDHNPRAGFTSRYFVARQRAHAAPTDVPLASCLALRSALIEAQSEPSSHPFALVLTLRVDQPCPADLALRIGLPAGRTARSRVDLPCDGLLSPVHWRAGDLIRSRHPLSDRELADIDRYGLWLGALRSSGAPPEHSDPVVVNVTVQANVSSSP